MNPLPTARRALPNQFDEAVRDRAFSFLQAEFTSCFKEKGKKKKKKQSIAFCSDVLINKKNLQKMIMEILKIYFLGFFPPLAIKSENFAINASRYGKPVALLADTAIQA